MGHHIVGLPVEGCAGRIDQRGRIVLEGGEVTLYKADV
jgi:hypothetical protein